MRWRRKEKTVPKDEEERIIYRFPIIPICIDNEYRWLERVVILQKYIAGGYNYDGCWRVGIWVDIRYLSKEESVFYNKKMH